MAVDRARLCTWEQGRLGFGGSQRRPVDFPVDVDITSPMASVHALRVCGESWFRGAGGDVNVVLARAGARCDGVVLCPHREAGVVKAGEEDEWILRRVTVRKVGRRAK